MISTTQKRTWCKKILRPNNTLGSYYNVNLCVERTSTHKSSKITFHKTFSLNQSRKNSENKRSLCKSKNTWGRQNITLGFEKVIRINLIYYALNNTLFWSNNNKIIDYPIKEVNHNKSKQMVTNGFKNSRTKSLENREQDRTCMWFR